MVRNDFKVLKQGFEMVKCGEKGFKLAKGLYEKC